MNRSVLLLIGILSACGVAFVGLSGWRALSDIQRTELFGYTLVSWFCCGGPLLGIFLGWQLNNLNRNGWQIARPNTNLKAEEL